MTYKTKAELMHFYKKNIDFFTLSFIRPKYYHALLTKIPLLNKLHHDLHDVFQQQMSLLMFATPARIYTRQNKERWNKNVDKMIAEYRSVMIGFCYNRGKLGGLLIGSTYELGFFIDAYPLFFKFMLDHAKEMLQVVAEYRALICMQTVERPGSHYRLFMVPPQDLSQDDKLKNNSHCAI